MNPAELHPREGLPLQTFRYRVAPELRILIEGFAAAVWVGTLWVLRQPGVDLVQIVLTLPIASIVGVFALYFGRLTRFEKVEMHPDRLVWTDLWRRTHTLPFSEVEGVETDRASLFGIRFVAKGGNERVRFFSRIEGSGHLAFAVRQALIQGRGMLPMSDLPWPGRKAFPFRNRDERWIPILLASVAAVPTGFAFCGGLDAMVVPLLGVVLWLGLTLYYRSTDQRVVVEDGDLILRDGWRERVRVPVGALRNVSVDVHDRGGSTATFDTDGGAFLVNSSVLGYDNLVQAAQEVVRDRFRNLPEG